MDVESLGNKWQFLLDTNKAHNFPEMIIILILNEIICIKINLHSHSYATFQEKVKIPNIHERRCQKYTRFQNYPT